MKEKMPVSGGGRAMEGPSEAELATRTANRATLKRTTVHHSTAAEQIEIPKRSLNLVGSVSSSLTWHVQRQKVQKTSASGNTLPQASTATRMPAAVAP